MRFTVGWDNRAVDLLADRWAEFANASQLSAAIDQLDDGLARHPGQVGMLLEEADPPQTAILDLVFRMNRPPGEVRVLGWSQLRFVFSVYVDDRTVTVWTIYEYFDEPV